MNKNLVCKCCSTNFEITNFETNLLKKLSPEFADKNFSIPTPSICPYCREQRRMAWRNERVLYRRKCDKTGKDLISMYSPESPHTVYHGKQWWDDSFDATDFGRDFDFSRPAFEQFRELQLEVPRMHTFTSVSYTHLTLPTICSV